MAVATRALVEALRQTAQRLQSEEATYRWAHFAHCNCGHLAQTITGLSPSAIYAAACEHEGDWAEQAARCEAPDFGDRPALDEGAWQPEDLGACPVTQLPMTLLFKQISAWGLDASDIRHLERLSDPAVRRRLGTNTTYFAHNKRENVVAYLRAWADLLEPQIEPVADDILTPLAAE